MAREFFDFDPLTGVAEYLEWAPDNSTFKLVYEQDEKPFVDFAKELANSGIPDGNFRGEGWLYAIIPPIVQLQMFEKGINFLDPNDSKKVIEEINQHYPWLKTTHRHHALR